MKREYECMNWRIVTERGEREIVEIAEREREREEPASERCIIM